MKNQMGRTIGKVRTDENVSKKQFMKSKLLILSCLVSIGIISILYGLNKASFAAFLKHDIIKKLVNTKHKFFYLLSKVIILFYEENVIFKQINAYNFIFKQIIQFHQKQDPLYRPRKNK
jgi:hypothetical protein